MIGFRTLLVVALLGALGTIGAGIGGYVKGHHAGYEELRADWDAQQIRQQADYAQRWREQAQEIEQLNAALRQGNATYEQNLRTISVQRDAALASVRNRAERPAVPASGGAAQACQGATGAELSRADAEFLVREAARADELRAALERCQGPEPVSDGRTDH